MSSSWFWLQPIKLTDLPATACPCSTNGATMFDINDFPDGSARVLSHQPGRSVSDPIVGRIIHELYTDPRVMTHQVSREGLERYLLSHLWRRSQQHNKNLVCERCGETIAFEGDPKPESYWNLRFPLILNSCSENLMRKVLA